VLKSTDVILSEAKDPYSYGGFNGLQSTAEILRIVQDDSCGLLSAYCLLLSGFL
jgi:hypothetical protein